jgi:hypothetical protein
MTGAKSLYVLLAAVKIKVKKVHLSYTGKCHNVYGIFYLEFFISQNTESINEKNIKSGQDNIENTTDHYGSGQK